ncbi:MAG: EamA family transporter, partial [Candidatus Eisenbacteria sp.]|nr:EamA family transporter [Candidatus Eisenbacteria bacterium]
FAASGSYAKALSRKAHIYVVTWGLITLALPWSALLLLKQGTPAVAPEFLRAAMISVVVNMIAVTLQVKALSISPLSLTMPFLAFTPLFMLVPSWVVLKEAPDALGLTGILLIVAGGYAIHIDKIRGGFVAPLKAIVSERGSLLMLLVAALWSISAVHDKVATVASSPAYYTMFFSLVFGVLYVPFLILGLRRQPLGEATAPRLFLLGFFAAVMMLSQFAAIELAVASYVIAIKRAGMVLSVVFGYLFFKEKHLRARLTGAMLMMTGVLVLSLQGGP